MTRLAEAPSDCSNGTLCELAAPSAPTFGVCTASCELFSTTCKAGTTCRSVPIVTGANEDCNTPQGRAFGTCLPK